MITLGGRRTREDTAKKSAGSYSCRMRYETYGRMRTRLRKEGRSHTKLMATVDVGTHSRRRGCNHGIEVVIAKSRGRVKVKRTDVFHCILVNKLIMSEVYLRMSTPVMTMSIHSSGRKRTEE